MKTYISKSPEETKKIARNLTRKISKGVVALSGNLGSGKTTFVQGFADGLGIQEKIISPTFVLMRSHKIPDTKNTLFHIDLYRLDTNNIAELGISEILNNPQNIALIEWAEKIESLLPKETIWISFETASETVREIKIGDLS